MAEFSVVSESGENAMISVIFDSKQQFPYTSKLTDSGNLMKAAIKEDIFKELVETYLKSDGGSE